MATLLAAVAVASAAPLSVRYIGPEGPVRQALQLTEAMELVPGLAGADIAVLVDAAGMPPGGWHPLGSFVRDGGGLVIFMGPNPDPSLLAELGLSGLEISNHAGPIVLDPTADGSAVLDHINWQAAPQVRDRTSLSGGDLRPLVKDHESGDAVIGESQVGKGRLFVVTANMSAPGNRPLGEWFYFNYLVFALAQRAAGLTPAAFADYTGSPVPHGPVRLTILLALAAMICGTLAVYVCVRHHSLKHPEMLRQLVRDREHFQVREGTTEWEHVGFHRAIASLMPAILNNIWLFVLITFVVNNVLFGWVMPSVQVRGALSLVATFFGTLWTLMDWGTAMAGMKFLSQYRVSDPVEGIKYVQFYVWWQAITGTIQVGIVVLVAIYLLPQTSLAYLSLFIVVHAMIQFPGFFTVINGVVMPGLHRFDYPQLIVFVMTLVTPLIQVGVCLAAVAWGRSHPVYDGVAGGLGLGASGLVAGFLSFGLSLYLYQRLGLSARVIFMAHFDWRTAITALKFGTPVTAAALLYAVAYSLQVVILSHMVLNYAEVQANFDVVCSFGMSGMVFPFTAIAMITGPLVNSFSEAFAAGKLKLCRYYFTMSVKWGQLMGAFLMAVLFAVGDRYILGSLGDQYERAAVWIRWFSVWGFLCAAVWSTDSALVGIGKPGLSLVAMIVEQGVRIEWH